MQKRPVSLRPRTTGLFYSCLRHCGKGTNSTSNNLSPFSLHPQHVDPPTSEGRRAGQDCAAALEYEDAPLSADFARGTKHAQPAHMNEQATCSQTQLVGCGQGAYFSKRSEKQVVPQWLLFHSRVGACSACTHHSLAIQKKNVKAAHI